MFNISYIHIHKIHAYRQTSIHPYRQTDRQTDRQTYMCVYIILEVLHSEPHLTPLTKSFFKNTLILPKEALWACVDAELIHFSFS